MRRLSPDTHGNITVDVDALRSDIRDKSVRVIDVRKEDEYKQNHIPTAVNLPLATLLADDSPSHVSQLASSLGIDEQTRVVVYDDTFGALASRVAWALEYIGHPQVSLLETTFGGWSRLGLEMDSAIPEVQKTTHAVSLRQEIIATHDYLDSMAGKNDVILIDNRERLNFLEQHIPDAINIPYRTLASSNRILRTSDDMKRLFANRGITNNSPVITYCGSVGTLSGLAYYALKSAGLTDVRLYVRSFKEWKSLNKPTARQADASYWDLSAE